MVASQGRKFRKIDLKPIGSGRATLMDLHFVSLLLIEISTYSVLLKRYFFSLFPRNLYFVFTFLLKSLLSVYFSIDISTFSVLFQ